MSWEIHDWVDFIFNDENYWDRVFIELSQHRLQQQVGKFGNFYVCKNCYQLGISPPLNCCTHEQLHSLADTRTNDVAKRSFIRSWVIHIAETARKPRPRGSEREITVQEGQSYLVGLRKNVDSLINEAIISFDHEGYQRAGFLALVAQEELVKMAWFAIEHMIRDKAQYEYPIINAKPGFNFRRLYLVSKGLRFGWGYVADSDFHGQFFLREDKYNMMDHDQKIKMAMNLSNTFMSYYQPPIMTLDHFGKYYIFYHNEEKLTAYLRYVDLDFDNGQLQEPCELMTKEEAFDRILFASALCHQWGHFGGFLTIGGVSDDHVAMRQFIDHARDRYQRFLDTHQEISSKVFPNSHLTEDEKDLLRREANY